jgi:hypothetical protein
MHLTNEGFQKTLTLVDETVYEAVVYIRVSPKWECLFNEIGFAAIGKKKKEASASHAFGLWILVGWIWIMIG